MTEVRPIVLCFSVAEVAESPLPDSQQRWCNVCATLIWVSAGEVVLDATFVCNACGLGLVDATPHRIEATPNQRRAGFTDAEANRLFRKLQRRHGRQ